MNVQAYFDYDSKKSGGLTVFKILYVSGIDKITSTYLINKADCICLSKRHHISTIHRVEDVNTDGVFL